MSSIQLPHDNAWLSCNHTFKSMFNIGTVREVDKHWINQYSGLFCVHNAEGHVMSWKMTRSLSFEHIQDYLIAIKQRLQRNAQEVEEFYVDNCCALRGKLKTYYLAKTLKFSWTCFMQCSGYRRRFPSITLFINIASHHLLWFSEIPLISERLEQNPLLLLGNNYSTSKPNGRVFLLINNPFALQL